MDIDLGKERLAAFFDALLAIIMTVLVLGLRKPDPVSWEGFLAIRNDLVAYFVSFFWLSALWAANHAEWEFVRVINRRVVWATLTTLLCASLIPYATSLLTDHFYESAAQTFYGFAIVLTTGANILLYRSLLAADPENAALGHYICFNRRMMPVDMGVKILGLAAAILWWPPAMSIATVIAAAVILAGQVMNRRSSRIG